MPASKLFEQLRKAAVARAAMSPPPAAPTHSSAHAEDMALDMANLKAETDAAVARTNGLVAEEALFAIRTAAELERAEIERLVAQQAQRLAELEREVRDALEVREASIDTNPRFPVARGFGVVAVLLALVLGWYFVPWRSPGADAAKAQPSLKIDPKLDLGRPK